MNCDSQDSRDGPPRLSFHAVVILTPRQDQQARKRDLCLQVLSSPPLVISTAFVMDHPRPMFQDCAPYRDCCLCFLKRSKRICLAQCAESRGRRRKTRKTRGTCLPYRKRGQLPSWFCPENVYRGRGRYEDSGLPQVHAGR